MAATQTPANETALPTPDQLVCRIFSKAAPLLMNTETYKPWVSAISTGLDELNTLTDRPEYSDADIDAMIDIFEGKAKNHAFGFLLSHL